jgi:hypothetical protein
MLGVGPAKRPRVPRLSTTGLQCRCRGTLFLICPVHMEGTLDNLLVLFDVWNKLNPENRRLALEYLASLEETGKMKPQPSSLQVPVTKPA